MTAGERHLWVEESPLVRAALRGALRGGIGASVARLLDARLPPSLPASLHLYLDNACGQACAFCEQPLLARTAAGRAERLLVRASQSAGADVVTAGVLDALLRAAAAREAPLRLEVTGNDWALHPRRDALLARLAAEGRVPVTLAGPSTALADEALARRVAALPTLERVVLTLQSARPERHDLCTGAPGSGERVLRALDHLRSLGAAVQVNTVLTARAVEALPELLAWLARRGLRATLLTFLPDGRAGGARAAALHPAMTDVRAALEAAGEAARAAVERVEGLPPCAVPEALRARLQPPWSTERREPLGHGAACGGCAARAGCGGVAASYLAAHGGGTLVPLGR